MIRFVPDYPVIREPYRRVVGDDLTVLRHRSLVVYCRGRAVAERIREGYRIDWPETRIVRGLA